MGQKGSQPDPAQLQEYYHRRHSFVDNPEERKTKGRESHGQSRHKKAKSKDLSAMFNAKHKQTNRNSEVSWHR